jgi:two-component system sensor histidine kinase RegB
MIAGQSPLGAGLRWLATARLLSAAALAVVLMVAHAGGFSIAFASLAATALVLGIAGALTFLRLTRSQSVTEREFFCQLLVDIAALTWVLYLTGHPANPVAGGYLLITILATVKLGPRLAWACTGLCVACYAVLSLLCVLALLARPGGIDEAYEYMASAMTFLLLLALAAWFGIRMSELRRQHRNHASGNAEKEARERYLVRLAALCAGTAHEMSTPLTTMALVLGELRGSKSPPTDWARCMDALWEQTQLCRRALTSIALSANVERFGKIHSVSARRLIHEVGDRFKLLRPTAVFRLRKLRFDDSIAIESDETLSHALLNLLNHAADASPTVEIRAARQDHSLVIQILDRGPGVAPKARRPIGGEPIAPKPHGRVHGAGVLIAQAAVERLGGKVQIIDRAGRGTCVQVELPLSFANQEIDHDDHHQRRAASR